MSEGTSPAATGLWHWLEERTGYRELLAPIRRRVLPHGPSWWYSTASCLLWLLVVQCVTGLLLMATYSPSLASAWASVFFIEQSAAGAYIRGVHYFAAQTMIVLFGVHVVRVMLAGAFRAPRELLWASGLLLLPLVLLWTITGNPLSGTVEGMSQIEVEGNIIGSTPVLGPLVRQILFGGHRPGNLTLTHLYFLHVGLMPPLVGGLLFLHLHQVYRHGLAGGTLFHPSGKPTPYWPYQTIRNMIALAGVLGLIAVLAAWRGAPMGAPADPDLPHTPRPEWYFLWLFELRRYFSGDWEFVATLVIPGAILLALLLLPRIDLRLHRTASRFARLGFVAAGLIAWAGLTAASLWRDASDPEYQAVREQSREFGARARLLAAEEGIPPEGAAALLPNDPRSAGPLLFRRHCAPCHSYLDPQGQGIATQEPSAPNLYGFGQASWIRGFLDPEKIRTPSYFGGTKFLHGDMAGKIDELFKEAGEEGSANVRQQLDQVAEALAAEAGRTDAAELSSADLAAGSKLISGALDCTSCHKFHDHGEIGDAPDLTGYASRDWLREMLRDPKQPRFYQAAKNDRMPAFAPDRKHPSRNLLTDKELELLVAWLRGEDALPESE